MLVGACVSTPANNEDKNRKAAESNTSLGLTYMERGQHEVALGKLKKAIRVDPDYAPAHTVLAILYERIGEIKLAGKHYQLAYKIDPEDGDVNNNYGGYLCRWGNGSKAIDHFEKALDDPFYRSPALALTNAGSCALSQGQMTVAEEYLRRALKFDPNFSDALMAMARVSFQQNNFLDARAFLQRFEAIASHRPDSLLLAYKIETASNDIKAATQYLRTLESRFPDSDQAAEATGISRK